MKGQMLEMIRPSRKQMVLITGIVFIAIFATATIATYVTSYTLTCLANADCTNAAIGVFKECACTTELSVIDFDKVSEGAIYEYAVYLKNKGTLILDVSYTTKDLPIVGGRPWDLKIFVIEFGLPCQMYLCPGELPKTGSGSYILPPGKVIKLDIVLYVPAVETGQEGGANYMFKVIFNGESIEV